MGTKLRWTPELERLAQSCVESGRYNNVGELVRSEGSFPLPAREGLGVGPPSAIV